MNQIGLELRLRNHYGESRRAAPASCFSNKTPTRWRFPLACRGAERRVRTQGKVATRASASRLTPATLLNRFGTKVQNRRSNQNRARLAVMVFLRSPRIVVQQQPTGIYAPRRHGCLYAPPPPVVVRGYAAWPPPPQYLREDPIDVDRGAPDEPRYAAAIRHQAARFDRTLPSSWSSWPAAARGAGGCHAGPAAGDARGQAEAAA